MLKQAVFSCDLNKALLKREDYKPFPKYGDRAAWEGLDGEAKAYYTGVGQTLKGCDFPALTAVRYMDFYRNGDREKYQIPYFDRRARLSMLTVAECVAGDGELIDDIINGVWAVCEETSWVLPAHINHSQQQARVNELPDIELPVYIDLFSAATGSLLTWVYYLLGDAIAERSPLVKRRIEIEIKRRILDPYLADDSFGWKGLEHDRPVNNWNPWINSNVLPAFLVLEADDAARVEGVKRTAASTQRFLDFYFDDGGCDEGPGYFGVAGASLLDYLEIIHYATRGAVNLYDQPLIAAIAKYIYRVHIAGSYFVNFADAAARVRVSAGLLERAGQAIGDVDLTAFARRQIRSGASDKPFVGNHNTEYRTLKNILTCDASVPGDRVVAPLDHYFSGIQVMIARQYKDSERGVFVAAKGGNNAESHNHNDIGNFIIYKDGKPVIIDVGVETYTKKTFSPQRYEIWTMQSSHHNLPSVGGADQAPGKECAAREVVHSADGTVSALAMDIAGAYPGEAGIKRLFRRVRLDRRDGSVEVSDAFSLASPQTITSHIMCFNTPEIAREGEIDLGGMTLGYDPTLFTARSEPIALTDASLTHAWGVNTLYRVLLTAKSTSSEGQYVLRFV